MTTIGNDQGGATSGGSSDSGFDLGSLMSGVSGIVSDFLTTKKATGDKKEQAGAYKDAILNSANLLKGGYSDQLSQVEQGADTLRGITNSSMTDLVTLLRGADDKTRAALIDAYMNYGDYIVPQVDQYGNVVEGATDRFAGDLAGTAADTADILREGSSSYQETYSPYMQSGEEARQYLMNVLGSDPSQLDPSQRRAFQAIKDENMATLAASGLRGAGRGGVAAVSEGTAAAMAEFERMNRARADNAASILGTQGFNATGRVADNTSRLNDAVADLRYKTGQQTAQQRFNTSTDVAKTKLGTAQDLAGKQYDTGNKTADATRASEGQVAGIIGNYYGNVGSIEGGRYQARGTTALNKAVADATAAGNVGTVDYYKNDAYNRLNSELAGRVGSTITDYVKANRENFFGANNG